jgi:hypothetical protein
MTAANFMDTKNHRRTVQPEAAAEILTADGERYDPDRTYYFFDTQTTEVRASSGLRRNGENLCAIGLKVVAVSLLRSMRDGALADGQEFFKSEVERNRARIKNYEMEKTSANRSLKTFLMASE